MYDGAGQHRHERWASLPDVAQEILYAVLQRVKVLAAIYGSTLVLSTASAFASVLAARLDCYRCCSQAATHNDVSQPAHQLLEAVVDA